MESRAATIADPCSQRLYDGWGQLPSRAQGGLACSGKGGERGPRLSYLERNTQRLHVDRSNFLERATRARTNRGAIGKHHRRPDLCPRRRHCSVHRTVAASQYIAPFWCLQRRAGRFEPNGVL